VLVLVGVDEVGRGPLAGPVVAAAVILPPVPLPALRGVRDSKKLSPARREALSKHIRAAALGVGVGWALPGEIDEVNILQATFLAMRRALSRLRVDAPGTFVLVDGDKEIPGLRPRQRALVRGDDRSLAVASASIVAKVLRDRWLRRLDRLYPAYGFARNKGYGTPDHLRALAESGPSPLHRRSFLGRFLEPS